MILANLLRDVLFSDRQALLDNAHNFRVTLIQKKCMPALTYIQTLGILQILIKLLAETLTGNEKLHYVLYNIFHFLSSEDFTMTSTRQQTQILTKPTFSLNDSVNYVNTEH